MLHKHHNYIKTETVSDAHHSLIPVYLLPFSATEWEKKVNYAESFFSDRLRTGLTERRLNYD